jgi:hypothetical protein
MFLTCADENVMADRGSSKTCCTNGRVIINWKDKVGHNCDPFYGASSHGNKEPTTTAIMKIWFSETCLHVLLRDYLTVN